ncbi:MAG: DUF4851 domain-containing protein [Desulfovibrio sp.]|nr:DUF4851 domain-containing protein [Desulfovibrio sp.]
MKFLFFFMALLVGAFSLVKFLGPQQPLRGLTHIPEATQSALASRARPVVLFVPAVDMELQTAGWRDLSPQTRVTEAGNARLWFAMYGNGTGVLVTALAEATDPWLWLHGQHEPFPVLQAVQYAHGGQTLYETIMVLQPGQNPFAPAQAVCLAYRAKFVLQFRKMQAIVQYHEIVDAATAHDAAFTPQLLHAFRKRGRTACNVVFPDKVETMKEAMTALPPADAVFSRSALSRWAGEMLREKDM